MHGLAVDGSGNVYAAWQDYRNEDDDIYFARSGGGGSTWSANLQVNADYRVSADGGFSLRASVTPIFPASWPNAGVSVDRQRSTRLSSSQAAEVDRFSRVSWLHFDHQPVALSPHLGPKGQ